MKGDGFICRKRQGISYYSCRAFEKVPALRHGFSTRAEGSPWDLQRRFLGALDLGTAHLATLRQVHSNRVLILEDSSGQWNRPEGDALLTRLVNVAVMVHVADCLPVLIADPVRGAVAAVHSGWRGTLSRVLLGTVRKMQTAFGSDPKTLLVAVGPAIRACCYEVGSDVAGLFDAEYPGYPLTTPIGGQPGKFHLDLCGALDIQLDLAGVPPDQRHDLGACTCCNTKEFFSYRAEGRQPGRMMAAIGLAR